VKVSHKCIAKSQLVVIQVDFHQFELKEKEEEEVPSQRPSMDASLSGEVHRGDNPNLRLSNGTLQASPLPQ
jgi:hypothetical protein